MKSYIPFLAFLAFIIVLAPSCQKDIEGCTDPDAENYNAEATTNNNSCTYERDKFLGVYNADEVCYYSTDDYVITITAASNNLSQVVIQNIYGLNDNATATVNGNSLTFNNSDFEGTGTINGNVLTLNFEVKPNFDECDVTAIKQ